VNTRSVRAVTFDMGGVLFSPPLMAWLPKWEERLGLVTGSLFPLLHEHPVAQRAMIGQASAEEMRDETQRRMGLSPEALEEFRADVQPEWNLELLAFIRDLRSEYKTGVISNATRGTRERAKEYVNDRTFDMILFSDEEGVAKPDPEIYRRAVDRLGVSLEETIYIDDWLPNVEAARQLGMRAVHHSAETSVMQLVKDLLASG